MLRPRGINRTASGPQEQAGFIGVFFQGEIFPVLQKSVALGKRIDIHPEVSRKPGHVLFAEVDKARLPATNPASLTLELFHKENKGDPRPDSSRRSPFKVSGYFLKTLLAAELLFGKIPGKGQFVPLAFIRLDHQHDPQNKL